jgi:group I intron endonuclease
MEPFYHAIQQPTDIPQTSGIYKITCLTTDKFYVGSAVNLYRRRHNHYGFLRRNEHHNPILQNAWNKYGEDVFTFEVLELVLVPFLIEREQFWLDKLHPFGKRGFNIARIAGSSLGREVAQSTRDKISATLTGRPGNVGYKPSPEIVEQQRLRMLGTKQSEETKRKRAISHTGKKHSPETIEKMRLSQIGKIVSPETGAKISAANKGYVPSDEARAKISAANTARQRTSEEYASRRKTLIVTAPDGTEYIANGIRDFAIEHGLDGSALAKVARGKYPSYKGWKARFPD